MIEVLEVLAEELACDAMTGEELAETERSHEKMMKASRQRERRTFFRLNQKIESCGLPEIRHQQRYTKV